MGASEIDLRSAEIEQTRRCLDGHIRQLESRLQPEQLMRPVVDRVRDSLGLGRAALLETVKREPVPLALTGIGLGWLVLKDLLGTYGRPARGADGSDADEPGTVQRAKEGVVKAARTGKEKVARTATAAREKVSHAAQGTVEGARKAADWVSHTFQEDPVLLGAAALAAGLIAGIAIPASRREEELAAPVAEKAVDTAQQAVETALDKAKEKVENSGGPPAPPEPPRTEPAPDLEVPGLGASAGQAETGEGD
jgi:hypothetical protein